MIWCESMGVELQHHWFIWLVYYNLLEHFKETCVTIRSDKLHSRYLFLQLTIVLQLKCKTRLDSSHSTCIVESKWIAEHPCVAQLLNWVWFLQVSIFGTICFSEEFWEQKKQFVQLFTWKLGIIMFYTIILNFKGC